MAIKGKKILITAGPTWVAIDGVRVISNIATGETGILLAKKLQHHGAKVTLLMGPTGACCLNKDIRLVHFKFFDELKDKLIRELRSKKYDIVIHSAAVSDYKPARVYSQKVKTNKKWRLDLVPTEKIIDSIKKNNPALFLVGFKLEIDKRSLLQETDCLMQRAKLDLAVANTIKGNRYQAYVMSKEKTYGPLLSKESLVKRLVSLMVKI